jgi:uncharacterized protein YfiM (DUF2279 family)
MRGLILLFTFQLGVAPQAIHSRRAEEPDGDRWFAPDKAKHFFAAAFVQTVSFSGLRTIGVSRDGSLVGATIATSAVSVGKELWDRTHGGDPSLKDLAWDAAGLLAASVLVAHTRR